MQALCKHRPSAAMSPCSAKCTAGARKLVRSLRFGGIRRNAYTRSRRLITRRSQVQILPPLLQSPAKRGLSFTSWTRRGRCQGRSKKWTTEAPMRSASPCTRRGEPTARTWFSRFGCDACRIGDTRDAGNAVDGSGARPRGPSQSGSHVPARQRGRRASDASGRRPARSASSPPRSATGCTPTIFPSQVGAWLRAPRRLPGRRGARGMQSTLVRDPPSGPPRRRPAPVGRSP